MEKQIKFGETTLTVLDVYPYMYPNNREVLRIKISEEDHSYEEITALRSGTDNMAYTEGGVTKNEYTGYTGGYMSSFASGIWDIELERKTELQRTVDMHEDAIIELAAMIAGLEPEGTELADDSHMEG